MMNPLALEMVAHGDFAFNLGPAFGDLASEDSRKSAVPVKIDRGGSLFNFSTISSASRQSRRAGRPASSSCWH